MARSQTFLAPRTTTSPDVVCRPSRLEKVPVPRSAEASRKGRQAPSHRAISLSAALESDGASPRFALPALIRVPFNWAPILISGPNRVLVTLWRARVTDQDERCEDPGRERGRAGSESEERGRLTGLAGASRADGIHCLPPLLFETVSVSAIAEEAKYPVSPE